MQPSQTSRNAVQEQVLGNVEFGENLLVMLIRKAEGHLAAVAPAHDKETMELLRSLLDIQIVQAKLGRERQRLSVFQC